MATSYQKFYNMNLFNLLKESGLSDKEAKTYLSALELGFGSMQEIAKKSGLKRSTTYDIVSNLVIKGIFAQTTKGKKKFYLAEDPERVFDLLKLRQENFKKALPELKSIFNRLTGKPKVCYFEGIAGLESIYWDTLESKTTILAYGAIDDMRQVMSPDFIKKYVEERVKRNIFERAIVPLTEESRKYALKNKEELREFHFVPKDRICFRNEINIYNNKVAIISFTEKIGLIIESQKIADTQRAIFELAWLGAAQLES